MGETLRNRPPLSKHSSAARGPPALFPPVTSDRPSFSGAEQAPSRPPAAAICKPVRTIVCETPGCIDIVDEDDAQLQNHVHGLRASPYRPVNAPAAAFANS